MSNVTRDHFRSQNVTHQAGFIFDSGVLTAAQAKKQI